MMLALQETSGCPGCSYLRNLPNPGIEAAFPASAGGFFTSEPHGKLPSCYKMAFHTQIH